MLSRLDDPAVLPDELLITAITLAELTVGPLVATTDHERAARQAHLQQSEADCYAVTFDASAARTFGRVAASLWQSGRRVLARCYDAMIAAIALTHALPVSTCNPGDLTGINGLEVVAVPVPLGGVTPVDGARGQRHVLLIAFVERPVAMQPDGAEQDERPLAGKVAVAGGDDVLGLPSDVLESRRRSRVSAAPNSACDIAASARSPWWR